MIQGNESCYFCSAAQPIEHHHVVPKRHGGSDEDENLVAVCSNCHQKLEALYDRQFYDDLGVEKEGGLDIERKCMREKCNGDADVCVEGPAEPVYFCETHAICCRCGQKAEHTIADAEEPYLRVYCEDCFGCDYGICTSEDVLIFSDKWSAWQRCPVHEPKEWYGESFEMEVDL